MQFIVSGQRIAVENFVTGKLYTILWKNDTQVTLTCISIGADCVVFQGEAPLNLFTLTMQNADTIDTIEPTQLGTTNYNNLINKPSINGVDLIGNKTSAALGIRDVPAIIESDDGKILTASSDGTYTWQPAPSSGTMDYTQLNNKPQINSVTLTGNVSLADLGAAAAADIPTTPADIGAEPAITSENMLDADLVDDTSSTHKFATAAQLAQIATNENNISSVQIELANNRNDGFTENHQIFDIEKWKSVGTHNGTTIINSDNSVTITATASDCYTGYTPNGTPNYPEQAKIPVSQGDKIYMTWTSDSDEQKGRVFIFGNADTTKTVNAYNNAGSLTYNVPSGVTFITFRLGVTLSGNSITYSNIMISKQQGATYQQYTPSNRELYEMILNL